MEPSSAPPLPVDAWMDFSCPFSFLACLDLRKLREEAALDVRWRSMLVRPPGLPPMTPGLRHKAEEARAEAARRARSEFGLELKPGPLEINTLLAHLAFKNAERSGFGDACHLAIMNAYWLDGARIDRSEVLEGIARCAGGIPWGDPALAEAVDGDIGLAQSLGLFFVPAVRFGERTIVGGAEPYEHIRAAARLAGEAASHPAGHTDVQRPSGGFAAA